MNLKNVFFLSLIFHSLLLMFISYKISWINWDCESPSTVIAMKWITMPFHITYRESEKADGHRWTVAHLLHTFPSQEVNTCQTTFVAFPRWFSTQFLRGRTFATTGSLKKCIRPHLRKKHLHVQGLKCSASTYRRRCKFAALLSFLELSNGGAFDAAWIRTETILFAVSVRC